MRDDKKAEYHDKLKTLSKRGCIFFSPREANGFWEIGLRDSNAVYRRIALNASFRDAVDEAYTKTENSPRQWLKFVPSRSGGLTILATVLLGATCGLVVLFLLH